MANQPGRHRYAVSIHAAREGGDELLQGEDEGRYQFQSTPPARAATPVQVKLPGQLGVSIHAAREGGDR